MNFKKISSTIIFSSVLVLNIFGQDDPEQKSTTPTSEEIKNISEKLKIFISENKAVLVGVPTSLIIGLLSGMWIKSLGNGKTAEEKQILTKKIEELEKSLKDKVENAQEYKDLQKRYKQEEEMHKQQVVKTDAEIANLKKQLGIQ